MLDTAPIYDDVIFKFVTLQPRSKIIYKYTIFAVALEAS